MRISTLDALFPRTRAGIFAATHMHPERWWYLSDLARKMGVPPSSLQRELAALTEAGLLLRRKDGNRVYYRANDTSPLYPELRGVMRKTAGLVDVLREALQLFTDRTRLAFVYGSIAEGTEHPDSDVDLMLIGDVKLADVAVPLRDAEHALGRAVNPTVFSLSEFARKARSGHHFIASVRGAPKLFILGTTDDLEAALERKPRQAAQDVAP